MQSWPAMQIMEAVRKYAMQYQKVRRKDYSCENYRITGRFCVSLMSRSFLTNLFPDSAIQNSIFHNIKNKTTLDCTLNDLCPNVDSFD